MATQHIYVNTRSLGAPLTGVQRYTSELLARFGDRVEQVSPSGGGRGLAGHAWEQGVLPYRVRDGLLWSPANTGPVLVRRQVVTLHDVVALDHPEWLGARFGRWYRALLPRLVRRSLRVITDSAFTKGRIVHHTGVDEQQIVVVPIGVDARFCPGAAEMSASAGALPVAVGRYLLFVGSLEPRKNLSRLLAAWTVALPGLPEDVRLVICGELGGRRVFGKYAVGALPDRVVLTGRVGDELLPTLYARALAFAYPSVYEGFGLPPLEAMASGVPVIAGDRAALPEVVGDAGILVDPYDVQRIADALVRIVNDQDLRSELVTRGLARARAFTWDRAATGVWKVLEEAGA